MHTNDDIDEFEDAASGRSTASDSDSMPSLVQDEALEEDIRDGYFDFEAHHAWVAGYFEPEYHYGDEYEGITVAGLAEERQVGGWVVDRAWALEDEGFESDSRAVEQLGSATGQREHDGGPSFVPPAQAGIHGVQIGEEFLHDGSDQLERAVGTFSTWAELNVFHVLDGARLRFGSADAGRPLAVVLPGILGATGMVHRTPSELDAACAIMRHLPLILDPSKGGSQHGGAAEESNALVRSAANATVSPLSGRSAVDSVESALGGAAEFFPSHFGIAHQVGLEFVDGSHGYEHLLGSCRIFFTAKDLFHEAAMPLDTSPERVPRGLWMEKWVSVPDGRVFMGRQYGTGGEWQIPPGDDPNYCAWVVAERNLITEKYGPNMFNRSMGTPGILGLLVD